MLTKSALIVLHHVATTPVPITIDTLVTQTGYSAKQIHRSLTDLTQTGDINQTRGSKNRKELSPGNGQLMTAYQRLIAKTGHIDWATLLTPTVLKVAWFLDTPTRITAIADRLHVTPQAVYHALDPVTDRAMLNPSGPEYALTDNIKPLHAVADAAATHAHRVRIHNLAPNTVIEWADPVHCLARPQTPDATEAFTAANDWHLTGLPAFTEYNLQFFTHQEPLFWYSQHGPPTPAELACHAIMTDPGPRPVSYAMLLIEKLNIDHNELKQLGERYDISSIVDAVIHALTADEWERDCNLPGPGEYEQLKQQYAVTNASNHHQD